MHNGVDPYHDADDQQHHPAAPLLYHHSHIPTGYDRAWEQDLLEPHYIPVYCLNLCCPWAPIYRLLDKLTDTSRTQNASTSSFCFNLTPFSAAQSSLTCTLPAFLTLTFVGDYMASLLLHFSSSSPPPAAQHHTSSPPGHWPFLPHDIDMALSGGHHSTSSAPADPPPLPPSEVTTTAVCLGVTCLLPTILWIRRKVDEKYHPLKSVREPVWQSGLVVCMCWPCALTQMEKEIDAYTKPSHMLPTPMSMQSHSFY
jgi:hypothetical protein